ncbi:EAL domain-containing protein, partial [Hungatella hathewayi]
MHIGTRKNYVSYTILGFLLGIAILSGFIFKSVYSAQSYSQLINYMGLVRGATQRLVKLELSEQPSDELIVYLDGILFDLETGEGEYGLLQIEDVDYRQCLGDLQDLWVNLKEDISTYRQDPAAEEAFLKSSEAYFEMSNKTVFTAEAYANRQMHRILWITAAMILCVVVFWLIFFLSNVRRVLHLENVNKDLSDKAGRDILTNAYTVNRFKEIAQKLLKEGAGEKFAVFYMDFADFNYINDVFGYGWGDRILKEYAALLSEDMKADEVFGRVNADNFVVLRRYETKEELLERQKTVDRKITDFMLSSQDKHALPICCGICCVEDVIEQLLIDGFIDRANYARKSVKTGENEKYCFYDEGIRRQLREEKTIEHNMEAALQNHEFVVYYQPKVSLETDQIVCSEALVRWRKPDGTLIPPDKFIPVFEKNHSIPLLDRYVLEEVCIWLRHLLDEGKPVLPVSVNVSGLQFYTNDFVRTYTEIRDKYRIPHELLEVEFTETILFDNWDMMKSKVEKLKAAGFFCSIDDFGKGYSSLSTVKNLDIDVVKLDALFFKNIATREKDQLLVEGIIHTVRQLGIVTVAEGIETTEQ